MKNKLHPLLAGASMVILAAGLHFAAPILNPLLIALILALSISPVLQWQLRRGFPKGLSVFLTILFVFIITLLLTTLISGSVSRLADKVPQYQARLIILRDSSIHFLSRMGIELSDIKSLSVLNPEKLVDFAATSLQSIFSTLSNFVVVLLLLLFLLIDGANLLMKQDQVSVPKDSWLTRFKEVADEIRRYISITAFTGLIIAVANIILLLILGVDFPILWGFLSFLFGFIPNIGFILSVISPALLALLEFGTVRAIIVVVGFVLINSAVENILRPKFIGKELNLSLSMIFISVIFWSWILGMIGSILAVPLTLVFKRVFKEIYGTKPQNHALSG